MSTGAIIVLVVVIAVVVAVVGWLVSTRLRSQRLRNRFGPEYDRTVDDRQDRRAAERELAQREKRHTRLRITPLSKTARDRYEQEWAQIQAQFVDQPETSVTEADRLVVTVMGERGYPTEGYQQQLSDLSVEHASTLEHYRSAHEIKSRHDESQASTEELREAMVHYRALFEELLEDDAHEQEASPHDTRS